MLSFIQTDNLLKGSDYSGCECFMQYLEFYDLSLMIKMCQKKNVRIIY